MAPIAAGLWHDAGQSPATQGCRSTTEPARGEPSG